MSENENKEVEPKAEETMTSLLKKKVAALQEKNKALMAKLKAQAAAIKEQTVAVTKVPIEQSKSFIESVRRFFEGVPNQPRLMILKVGEEYVPIAGTPSKQKFKDGLMLLENASMANYDLNTGEMEMLHGVGDCYICKQNIFMVMNLPRQ